MSHHIPIGRIADVDLTLHQATGEYGRTGVEIASPLVTLTALQCRTLAALLIVGAEQVERLDRDARGR